MLDLLLVSCGMFFAGFLLPTMRNKICPTSDEDTLLDRARQRKFIIDYLDTKLHDMRGKEEAKIERLTPKNGSHKRYRSHDEQLSTFSRQFHLQPPEASSIHSRRMSVDSTIPEVIGNGKSSSKE